MTTTSPRSRRPGYHHGNLRATLVALGSDLLSSEGLEAVTLRALAEAAGVSHRAAYRHFADKDELLAAVVAGSYRELAKHLAEARAHAPAARLVEIAILYARERFEHGERERSSQAPVADISTELTAIMLIVGDGSATVHSSNTSTGLKPSTLASEGLGEIHCNRFTSIRQAKVPENSKLAKNVLLGYA